MESVGRRQSKLIAFVILAVLIVVGAALILRLNSSPPESAPTEDISYQIAVWEWRAPTEFSAEDVREYMDFAGNHNIDTVYIDLSAIVDINELAEPEKTQKLTEFGTALKQFTQEARRRGIEVEALAGSVQWSNPDFQYLPLQVMEFVSRYNFAASVEERLSGVQFDIETYNQPDFDDDKAKKLVEFLDTVARIQAMHQMMVAVQPEMRLGFSVPYWYDNENGNLPEVSFDGTTKPVGSHLMDSLNKHDNGYVVIMDYRDKAEGNDGSIAHAEGEFDYAETSAPKVKIIIGQLLTKADPDKTTFYKKDRAKLDDALRKLHAKFNGRAAYGGFALHDFRGYQKLVD